MVILMDFVLPFVQRFSAHADARFFQEDAPVVIIGGGVVGSSVAYHLSKRGKANVLIDTGHSIRGSWGRARSVHLCQYTQTRFSSVRRAINKFRHLEEESGLKILHHLGGSPIICDEEERAEWIEILDRNAVPWCDLLPSAFQRIAPGLNTLGNRVLWVDESYIGDPENTIESMRMVAEKSSNCIIEESSAISIDRNAKTVRTESGTIIRYSKLVISAGVWTNKVLKMADLKLMPIIPTLEQIFYFNQKPGYEHLYKIENFVNSYFMLNGKQGMYFYPDIGVDRMKVAIHCGGPFLVNDTDFIVPSEILPSGLKTHCYDEPGILNKATDIIDNRMLNTVQNGVRLFLPHLNADDLHLGCRCYYANTTDAEWIIGKHPEDDDVLLATGFNGEGFKHSPVVGEFVADLIADDITWSGFHAVNENFSPSRFEQQRKVRSSGVAF